MKTKQFYPLLALLFSLLLTLAFTGQAKAESTVADCGTSVNTSATITVTDDLDYGLTRFAATSPADVSICNEIAEPHWSIPMCGDEIWSGWVEVPTACNTVTISDTQVTQVTWIDESVMWDVSGQELIRATVTETVPTRVEIWEEDSGRKLILFNLDNTMFPVYLDSVVYNDWVDNGDGKKKLTINNATFNASFNLGDQPVIWENYAVYWRVSESNTVDRIKISPTRVEIWEEDSGRKLILFNLDNTMFPVYLDSVVYNDWVDNGDGKKKLTINNATFNASFNLGDQPVIWENYAVYWRVSESNTVDRIKISPTRVQVFSENFGADLFLYNIDNKAFAVFLDGVVYNDWRPTEDGKLKLSIVGMNNAQSFNMSNQPVIWEVNTQDWAVTSSNTVDRVLPALDKIIFLPAVMR